MNCPLKYNSFYALAFYLFFLSCTGKKETKKLFLQLNPNESGILFSNDIHELDTVNPVVNEFAYMGGGVGIGDFNNDGKKDIFFCGNQVSSRLYLNKGNNQFEDITQKAGLLTSSWCTGVSVVDINNDGYEDLYVCVYGKENGSPNKNLLFINNGNAIFKEAAADYGLADTGYSSQAGWFDYDKDGDLDCYVMNYFLNGPNANNITPKDLSGHSPANDRLYRNDGLKKPIGHPVFTEVSMQAGIRDDGYGLGLSISDYNNDGWPDIYVSNDFISNDLLWINNKNGSFTNRLADATNHQSYSGMGSDAADINNDGLTDIITLDMMPEDNKRKKLTYSFMNYERYQAERLMGYTPEFMRNMLQLNCGNHIAGDTSLPLFSEIGQLAGISETDWSWSVLMADFDLDAFKDIHITNGIGRDFINADFIQFARSDQVLSHDEKEKRKLINRKLASLNHIKLPNYYYHNNHDLSFTNIAEETGLASPTLSSGAAYADLDNDGDADLVMNNINEPAGVFINQAIQTGNPLQIHFLAIDLIGKPGNKDGIGARIYLYSKSIVQMQEQQPERGYLSSVDKKLIFGLNDQILVDSLLVIWPTGNFQLLKNINADEVLELKQEAATDKYQYIYKSPASLITDITISSGIQFQHTEADFYDFSAQHLLPQKYSQLGPFICSGDINGDGRPDFYIGNGFNQEGRFFITGPEGKFTEQRFPKTDKFREDAASILFDADQDTDNDLLLTYGDMRYEDSSIHYHPVLFLNDGKGHFTEDITAIPLSVRTIGGAVTAADFDEDGDMDVFIGGRISRKYPVSPRSYLLQNDKGKFTDITAFVAPALEKPGMITAARFADWNGNGSIDLLLAGEWMPLKLFNGNKKGFTEVNGFAETENINGMWRSLEAADLDNDGDLDFIAGNYGKNNKFGVAANMPMELYTADLDGNGSLDPVMFYYIKDETGNRNLYPAINRDQLAEQVPAVKKQFLLHKDFADATYKKLFKNKQDGVLHLSCNEMASCWFENNGKAQFIKHTLPIEAQFAPVNAIVCYDIDSDGIKDLLLAGNEYQTEVMTGRYDASYGCILKGIPGKNFLVYPSLRTGWVLRGDVKSLLILPGILLAGINNSQLRIFRLP